jgi:hypothetical protein
MNLDHTRRLFVWVKINHFPPFSVVLPKCFLG